MQTLCRHLFFTLKSECCPKSCGQAILTNVPEVHLTSWWSSRCDVIHFILYNSKKKYNKAFSPTLFFFYRLQIKDCLHYRTLITPARKSQHILLERAIQRTNKNVHLLPLIIFNINCMKACKNYFFRMVHIYIVTTTFQFST